MEIRSCCTCLKNKKNTIIKRVGNHFFDFCSECYEDLLWTQQILRSGTDWIVEKHPDRYVKTSQFSITEI